jgi:hypothetical protein
MGYDLNVLNLRVAVSESHIRAADLATFLEAINTLYEALAAVFLFESEPFENRRRLLASDAQAVLRTTKLWSGSDVHLSLLGIDKPIEALRKIVDDIRFRKERRRQEEQKTKQLEEKTDQERLRTQRMRLENIRRIVETFKELKMSPEDQREFLRLAEKSASAIEENRNALLTE